jgi:ABC-type multidrug transport system permease subunit
MATEPFALPRSRAPGRPSALRLVGVLTGYRLRSFARNPIAAFFTVGMPVLMLLVIGALFGNEVIEPRGSVRVAQFFTPMMAVFGAAQAAFGVLATDTALMRERGVFRRLHGTPVPPWVILTGWVSSAIVVAGLAVALVVATGVAVYQVQIVWRTVPASLLTLLVGVASFAALGLAVTALVRSPAGVQSLTTGVLIPLAFISDVFTVDARMPVWLDRLGWFFPLRHFGNALSDAFNPYLPGDGFAPGHLAVLAAWGVAGALVAAGWFAWEPRRSSRGARRSVVQPPSRAGLRIVLPGRPSAARSLGTQMWYALVGLARDSGSVFFAILFPVVLLALIPVVMGGESDRTETAAVLLPAMMTYGLAVTAFATLPAPIAESRQRGALARLAGTPMPRWSYLAGRITASLIATTATACALLAVAVLGFGVRIAAARLPVAAVAFLLGVLCFAALGLAVLTLIRSSQAVIAVTLGTLLPLCYISDVFVIGARMPQPLAFIADLLPLKHTVHALGAALAGTGFAWTDLAVVAAWAAVGTMVARRLSLR